MICSQIYSGEEVSFPVQKGNFCFTCSKIGATPDVVSVVLEFQSFVNSAEERRTILQVICQLLRVQWELVAEVMTLDDGSVPFCAICFKAITEIILLREKLFQIETEIRDKLKKLEDTLAMSWAESGHKFDELEPVPGRSKDHRMTFQRQVMEEIRNKELMQRKVAEFHQSSTATNRFDLKPSMVQLHFAKNIFEISGNSCQNEEKSRKMTSLENTEIDIDKVECDEMPPVLEVQNWTPQIPGSDRETHDESMLMRVSPTLVDIEMDEACPRKKAKSADEVTTITCAKFKNISTENDFIQAPVASLAPQSKKKFFIRSEHNIRTMVKVDKAVKPPAIATSIQLWKPPLAKSSSIKNKALRNTRSSRSQVTTFNKPATATSINNVALSTTKTQATGSLAVPKTKSPVAANYIESDLEFDVEAETDQDDSEWIDDDEKITEYSESEASSDDSEGLSDDTPENEVNSETTNEQQLVPYEGTKDIEVAGPSGSQLVLVSPSELYQKQRFNPKRSFSLKVKEVFPSKTMNQPEATFIAKDKTIWTTKVPSKVRKVREYEVLREKGGLIGPAKNTNLTPVEIFKLMFPPSIVETIVTHTNAYAEHMEKTRAVSNNRITWYPVTVDELYAYIGILLHLGLEKKCDTTIREVWTSEEKYTLPAIVATMSKNRFTQIQINLRFDDTVARKSSRQPTETKNDTESKRSYISEILDPFIEVMQSHLSPYDTLIVDEMLVKFSGHAKFRVYMKSKPGKLGFKFWAVCDVETGYILKISLYHGKVGDTVAKELGKTVVLDLVKKYFNSGRAVTMDNFFTSKSLGEELMKHKMSMLGTLNRNRMDVIPEFVDARGRAVQSSLYAFQGNFTMVSYIQRKNRAVILMSTQHHSPDICAGKKNKPQMILDYNATKSGVDIADLMIAKYRCQRITNRWPMKIFYALLDIAALNAYNVHKLHASLEKGRIPLERRPFLRNLSESLMEPNIASRLERFTSNRVPIPRAVYKSLLKLGYETKPVPRFDTTSTDDSNRPTKGKCVICPRKRKDTRTRCTGCNRYVCAEHKKKIHCCKDCESILLKSDDEISNARKSGNRNDYTWGPGPLYIEDEK